MSGIITSKFNLTNNKTCSLNSTDDSLEELIYELKDKYKDSTVDVLLFNIDSFSFTCYSRELLSEFLRVVKPLGDLVFRAIIKPELSQVEQLSTRGEILSALKLCGWIDVKVEEPKLTELEEKRLHEALLHLSEKPVGQVIKVACKKPGYEIGLSTKLPFKKAVPASVAAVWKLEDTVENDIIDDNELLDEDDLIKPDPGSLKVCGTTGKRKACKDCSCGLAEELTAEGSVVENSQPKASSCGNCYLGDAFRCSTCPYLGMPAFKHGEKIQLSDIQLKADM